MELLFVLLGFLLEQGATTVRSRLRTDPPGWANQVRGRIAQLTSLRLTNAEADAVERWRTRSDVVAALVEGDGAVAEEVASRVVNALVYELGGANEPGLAERATEIAVATAVNLIEVVDPATAASLAVHDTLRAASSDLKSGQAEMYVVLLEILDRLGAPREAEAPTSALVMDDIAVAADAVSIHLARAVERVRRAYERLASLRGRSGNLGSTLRFHTARDEYNQSRRALREVVRDLDVPLRRLDDQVSSDLLQHLDETVFGLSEATVHADVPGFPDEFPLVDQLSSRLSSRVEELRRVVKHGAK